MRSSWLLPLAAFLAVGCITPAAPAAPAMDPETSEPVLHAVAFDAPVYIGEDSDCLGGHCTSNSPVELYAPPFNVSLRAARIDIPDAGVGGPVHWRVFCKVQGCGGTLAEGNSTLPLTIDLPALTLPMGAALYLIADAPYDVPLSNAAAVLLRSTTANGTAWIA